MQNDPVSTALAAAAPAPSVRARHRLRVETRLAFLHVLRVAARRPGLAPSHV